MTSKQSLKFELADLQCLRSCAEQGFTIQDWIEFKESVIGYQRRKLLSEKTESGHSLAELLWHNAVPHQSANDLGYLIGSPQAFLLAEYYALVDGDKELIESVIKDGE